jgi:hypothetical protein
MKSSAPRSILLGQSSEGIDRISGVAMENLAPAVFALIVFTVLFFAAGVSLVSRFPDEKGLPSEPSCPPMAQEQH